MVQHRVAEHEVEALVGERQLLGVGGIGPHLRPEALRVGRQGSTSMPGEMSLQVASSDQPGAQQVEREVARSRADLQRAGVVAGLAVPSALRTLASTCSRPSSPKSMPHLES